MNVIELVVKGEREKEICDFENKMFAEYEQAIAPYALLFDAVGCELKLVLGWCNHIRKTWSANRIPLRNGYECYVYCLVEKGGKEVRIKSCDGEADYYPMETEWMVSSVSRRFHKLKVSLYKDLDDIDADMKNLLSQLRNMNNEK